MFCRQFVLNQTGCYLIAQTKVFQRQLHKLKMEIKEAKTDQEILSCWPTMQGLRPHVKPEEFLSRIREIQAEGYHLMYIQDPEDNITKSIVGYRTLNYLYSGKTLYIDDVATLPEGRGKGFSGALLDWIKKYAKENGHNTISLDTGFTRLDAHRLYLNKGFNLSAHHMSMNVQERD